MVFNLCFTYKGAEAEKLSDLPEATELTVAVSEFKLTEWSSRVKNLQHISNERAEQRTTKETLCRE